MKPDLRVYGEVRGLPPEAWAALAPDCPFEDVAYADGELAFEYEGRFLDADSFLEALCEALSPGGGGHADVIDNDAWTITRYALAPGKCDSQTFGIDDVLENTKNEGNI
ncbi:MAG: hypothetical protein VB133_15225 [Anaeromusa sp.]|uniref:hypothetical protein n=1 Tax=Anaeromusa sp. TaxID=1872520 RepID=UPI002B1F48BC|nr:hypothetical protein [Anaeromusa sp.]MEA4836461.1 hypothetical protein [Anaeromusa sp.]